MSDEERKELAELQSAQSRLGAWRQELLDWRKEYSRAMTIVNGLIGTLGKRINDIKSGDGQIVTDHALVRYLERYEHADIEALRAKVAALPNNRKVVINNNVLTVVDNLPPVNPNRHTKGR